MWLKHPSLPVANSQVAGIGVSQDPEMRKSISENAGRRFASKVPRLTPGETPSHAQATDP